MPAPISTNNAEHYTWSSAGDNNPPSDAWYLVRTPTLNIIEELMPPGASETPHHHTHARQFFYILAGELTLILEGQPHTLNPHQGLEVPPAAIHQAINRSDAPVRFLVTSNPPSHNDRTDHEQSPTSN
jgi:mannose-6-phosphate isomerase-like protein (cupin superfamily)